MAIVNQRSANAPNYTNSSQKYVYSFVQPPPAWSAQAPAGITMDDKIMPNRDLDDAANGTDTWRVMRGVDLYFAAEGALERYYASNQFNLAGIWPRNNYTQTRSRGVIESNLWQWTTGTGLANCYTDYWLKGISSSSDLSASYSKWADGTDIDGNPPAGSGRAGWYYALDFAIGKWTLPEMASRSADFAPGQPIAGDAVRRVYYDLERLQWYTPHVGDGTAWNVSHVETTQWARSSWSTFVGGYTPAAPLTGTSEIWHEERHVWDLGEPDERGGYWGFYTNSGVYTTPRTGLLNSSGSRTDYFGSEQACYLALHLIQGGDDVSQQRDIYEFWKVPFSITALNQVQVAANQVSNAAYSMVNKWNAGVPRQLGADYRWTEVYLNHVCIVCKTGDRTDVSQLGWNWRP